MVTGPGDRLDERRGPTFALIAVLMLLLHGTGVRAQTACVGDCDESGSVRVNELIVGVNIALERAALSLCASFDASGNAAVEVNELVTGVNNALGGCPAITDPSPTASATIRPPTPTSTATATVLATVTATLTVTLGTATPTEAVEEATETPTAIITVVGTATPTGTVEEATATPTATRTGVAGSSTPTQTFVGGTVTPTLTVGVGTATPTGAVEEATATPTLTMGVGTSTPTGIVDETTATPTLTIVVGTSTPTGTVGDQTPTATATFTMLVGTSTPTGTVGETPTPTATPTLAGSPTIAPAARFAGATTVVVNSLGSIPALVGAIANGFHLGMAITVEGGGPAACPGGGLVTKTGDPLLEQDLDIVLNNCRVPTRDGFVTYNGRILQSTVYFTVSDGNTMLPGPFTAVFENGMGMPTMTARAQIAATVNLFQSAFEGPCAVTNLSMEVSDTISMTTSGGASASMTFANTEVVIDDITFSDACVPMQYRVTLTGDADLSSSVAEPAMGVMFNGLVLAVDDSIEPVTFSISGGFASPCFGGTAAVATQMLVALPDDEICPAAGEITASVTGATTRVVYHPDQSVGLDVSNDGTVDQTFPHCQDPRLYECPA